MTLRIFWWSYIGIKITHVSVQFRLDFLSHYFFYQLSNYTYLLLNQVPGVLFHMFQYDEKKIKVITNVCALYITTYFNRPFMEEKSFSDCFNC